MKSDIDPQDNSDQSQSQQQFTDPESIEKVSQPQTGASRQQDGQDGTQSRQDASQSRPQAAEDRTAQTASAKPEKFDYYVHLANGEVRKLTRKAFGQATEKSGTPNALNENGVQHSIIGVYPREVELPQEVEDNE